MTWNARATATLLQRFMSCQVTIGHVAAADDFLIFFTVSWCFVPWLSCDAWCSSQTPGHGMSWCSLHILLILIDYNIILYIVGRLWCIGFKPSQPVTAWQHSVPCWAGAFEPKKGKSKGHQTKPKGKAADQAGTGSSHVCPIPTWCLYVLIFFGIHNDLYRFIINDIHHDLCWFMIYCSLASRGPMVDWSILLNHRSFIALALLQAGNDGGLVWNGMEWYGLEWIGIAWYGMVWYVHHCSYAIIHVW